MADTPDEKVKFGINQIGNVTPSWAKWVFRIFFYMSSTAGLALTVFTSIPDGAKLDIMTGITFANAAVHGLSKMFGINEEPTDYYKKP